MFRPSNGTWFNAHSETLVNPRPATPVRSVACRPISGITNPHVIAPMVNRTPNTRYAVPISPGLKLRIRNWPRLGAPAARKGPTLNQAPSTALAASQAGAKRMMRRFIMRASRPAWLTFTRGTHARSRTSRKGTSASTYIAATIVNASEPN